MLLRSLLASTLLLLALPAAGEAPPVLSFPSPVAVRVAQSASVDYRVNQTEASFLIYVPSGYKPDGHHGLVVYISPSDQCRALPPGWKSVLDRNGLLFVCPQGAGNGSEIRRRRGLGVIAALQMLNAYTLDPARVYVAGLSGGARIAGDLGFYQSDLFHGTIQSCGTNFYKQLPVVRAGSQTDTQGSHYGVAPASPREVQSARQSQKFVLITGPGDFRHGNILDIYEGGYAAEGFNCKLIDVPGMGHEDCSGTTLQQALDFLK